MRGEKRRGMKIREENREQMGGEKGRVRKGVKKRRKGKSKKNVKQ